MRKTLLWLAILGVAWMMPARADPQPAEPPRNIILMGWDGCHRDHVKALLGEHKLPNLRKLIDEGTMVEIDVTSGATDTKAGWSQILTGYKPEVTGVYNNTRYRDIPPGYSIFERLKDRFGADQFAAVAVIGKKRHCGEIDAPCKRLYDPARDDGEEKPAAKAGPRAGGKQPGGRLKPQRGRVVVENGQQYMVFEGSPYFTMHKACDEWIFGLMEDRKVGDTSIEMLDKYKDKPFFFFVHCAEVDENGHKFGEPSGEYNDAIISGDAQLGRLAEKLAALNLYAKTRIYVVADHGFDVGSKGHAYAPYVFLATNDKKVIRGGTRADIAPTIMDRLGLDLSTFNPRLDGASLLTPAVKPAEKAPAGAKPGR